MNNIENLDRKSYEELIDNWIFNEKDRNLAKRRFLDGLTFEQLAEEFNYSVNGVKRRFYKCRDEIAKHIK